ncbi:MAG: hypothetical protein QM731_24650 [Chitinophagaceae bacterium]
MKNHLTSYCLAILVAVAVFSCKKGDKGDTGNANVTQYSFGAQNLASTSFVTLSVTTTQDTMNNSAWFVYLYYQTNDRWYFIPGYGIGGSTQYRLSMGYSSSKVNLYIDKIGAGESYAAAKVVRVYMTNTMPGGRVADPVNREGLPNIDFTDYNAVKKYYHLPD